MGVDVACPVFGKLVWLAAGEAAVEGVAEALVDVWPGETAWLEPQPRFKLILFL